MRRRVIIALLAAAVWLPPAHADTEFEACRAAYAEVGLPKRLGDSDVGGETQARCFKGFDLVTAASDTALIGAGAALRKQFS